MPSVAGLAGSRAASASAPQIISAPAFTRPNDTTGYADKDLVANSTSNAAVVALAFQVEAKGGGVGRIVGARIQKSTNSVTNAAFRLHLFTETPTFVSAGDNSALSSVVVGIAKGYLGYVDITAMTGLSDVAWGTGAVDSSRLIMPYVTQALTLYGFLEAKAAYTPGAQEVFTVSLLIEQD